MIKEIFAAGKIYEVIEEMKKQDIWKKEIPGWVSSYSDNKINIEEDFTGWLQFVFLPNLLLNICNGGNTFTDIYIVLQAKKFFAEDIFKGRLLQLLIELDAINE